MDDIDPRQAYQIAQQIGTSKEEPINGPLYQPPPGRPNYELNLNKYKYVPDEPTQETLQLEDYEQRHVYQLAWRVASIFGPEVQPIPDAMYAIVPQAQKATQLFCVVSRSSIKRLDGNRIAWPVLQVVIKEIPVVKVVATLDFSRDTFDIWQLIFWRNDISSYEKPLSRGNQPFLPAMIPAFISRYARAEGIV